MKIYQDSNNLCWLNGTVYPTGSLGLSISDSSISIWEGDNKNTIFSGDVTELVDAEETSYVTIDAFLTACVNFFVNASASGGGSSQVINMKPGEYLSDIIQSITDASVDKPYTINFYNHSKTIDWSRWNGLIHVPRFVAINFVGNIDWWPNDYSIGKGFDEGLLSNNPTDKLFLGFSFDRTNENSKIFVSGLPSNINKIFFGGLDQSYQEASSYQGLIDNPGDWGEFEFNLVRVNGSKDDDVRNDALYKKINGVFIDITPNFKFCDLIGMQFIGAYLYSANLGYANLGYANLGYANLRNANLRKADLGKADLGYANLGYANLGNAYLGNAYLGYADLGYANLGYADLGNANLGNANLDYAYLWNANLGNANLWKANLENIQVNTQTNFSGAILTGAVNLPEYINTKAKFIAAVGVNNVNAETIWIDGTSILS